MAYPLPTIRPVNRTHIVALGLSVAVTLCGCSEKSPSNPPAPKTATPQPANTTERAGPVVKAAPLTAKQRGALAKTTARVLLPKRTAWRQSAFLTAGENWYAASIDGPDYTITIEGTRQAFDHPEIRAAFKDGPAGRAKPRIGRNELVVEAAFVEHSTAFSVEVDCQHPDKNPRCTQDAFVLQVVADLEVIANAAPAPASAQARRPGHKAPTTERAP